MRPEDPAAHLHHALAKDAFDLHCQPIASLGGLVRAYPMGEILLRLREEEEAQLPPGEFLPVLEHYGLMPQLDRWVLRETLRRLAVGSRIPRLSINLAAQTLADSAFPGYFAAELTAARVPGSCILFEVEEHDAMEAPDSLARFAALAASLGSGLVIDGFGHTADALQLLIYVPGIRAVKLHGPLVREVLLAGKPTRLVERYVGEATRRGVMAIAESVEEAGALPRLKSLGISYAQGFGVYRPRPLESFVEPHALLVA